MSSLTSSNRPFKPLIFQLIIIIHREYYLDGSFLPDYIDCEIGSVEGEEAGEETSSGIYEGDDRSGTLKQEIVLVDECGERGEAAAEPDREEELDFRG